MNLKNKIELGIKLIKNKDPFLKKKIIRAIYENLIRIYFKFRKNKGKSIFEENWDYLIVLDACRYDIFKKINKINGILSKKTSLGSDTEEWFKNNFKTPRKDLIYVMSNPKFLIDKKSTKLIWKQRTKLLYKIENVWKYGWDKKRGTVHPRTVNKAVMSLKNKYPGKKMVIHYLQPHAPYIGKTKIKINKRIKKNPLSVFEIQDLLLFGKIDTKLIKQAYEDNLRLALQEADKLIKNLEGKIVITADHGEAFGEKNLYFHPEGIHIKELIEVPWLVINKPKTSRKKENTELNQVLNGIRI